MPKKTKAVAAAIKGKANKVGNRRFTIKMANRTKPTRIKIPDIVLYATSCFLHFTKHGGA